MEIEHFGFESQNELDVWSQLSTYYHILLLYWTLDYSVVTFLQSYRKNFKIRPQSPFDLRRQKRESRWSSEYKTSKRLAGAKSEPKWFHYPVWWKSCQKCTLDHFLAWLSRISKYFSNRSLLWKEKIKIHTILNFF